MLSGTVTREQDGVEAPPEEERLAGEPGAEVEADLGHIDPDLAGDSDLSFATMFARSLGGEADRAPSPFVSSLDQPLGGPGTPLGGDGGRTPIGGSGMPIDGGAAGGAADGAGAIGAAAGGVNLGLSGIIGALPGLSAAAGRSAEAAATHAPGGLPPPPPGLLDDPWGQLSGLPGAAAHATQLPLPASAPQVGFGETP